MKSTSSIAAASTVTLPHGEVLTRFSKKNLILMLLSNGVFQVLGGSFGKSHKKNCFQEFQLLFSRRKNKVYLKVAIYAATLFIASSLAKDMAMGRICIPNISPLLVPRIPDLKFFNCLATYQSCSPANLGEFKVLLPSPAEPWQAWQTTYAALPASKSPLIVLKTALSTGMLETYAAMSRID